MLRFAPLKFDEAGRPSHANGEAISPGLTSSPPAVSHALADEIVGQHSAEVWQQRRLDP